MALEDTITLLGRAPIIGLLGPDALRILAFSADTRRLRAGETLFRRGERSDGGYVIMSGAVAVGREPAPEGTDDALLGPGSLVGRTALFVRMQRPATALAREASSLLRISPTLMRRVLQEFPAGAAQIRTAIAQDLEALSEGLGEVQAMLERVGEPATP